MPRNTPRKGLAGLMQRVTSTLGSTYTSTYYSQPANADALKSLRDKIDSNIDRIVNANMDTAGVPSVSKLYSRLKIDLDKAKSIGRTGDPGDFFNDALNYDDFYATFQNNRYLVEMDAEIDSTCKYFPDLEEALAVMREGVLSPDYFSKDFLTLTPTSTQDMDSFNERAKDLKKRYNLLPFINDVYYETSKYGETFIYMVPYKTALSRLLTDKPNTNPMNPNNYSQSESGNVLFNLDVSKDKFVISESGTHAIAVGIEAPTVFSEATSLDTTLKNNKNGIDNVVLEGAQDGSRSLLDGNDQFHLKVELSYSGVIESVIRNAETVNKRKNIMESTASEFRRTVLHEDKSLKIVKKDKRTGKLSIAGMEKEIGDDGDEDLSPDGLIGYAKQSGENEVKVDVPGCVMAKIRREQVIPIYIGENNTCLGYYYIELRSYEELEDFRGMNYIMSDSLTSIRGSNSGMNAPFNCVDPTRQEELLKYVASQLSTFIDKQFINANQDLRQEIYAILKYNDLFNTPAIDKMKITFIPPEDVIHVFFKLDPFTHRGISDLDRAMVPAKIYASMYITDAIGKLVRGQDKRVFYVKQSVDSNIAQTLMNVINQVKQGNFGFRQFSNINNVLNITGKFNDYFIPTSPSGDSPLQIEVLPGQQFTDNSEQMQQLREMAVNATDVPFEIIQMRQSVDYAMQLSMSNAKFLRKIYAKQGIFAPYLSRLVTKLYNFEYEETEDIEVTLPPPVFINTANTNQLVDNTKQYVQNIAEIELANEEDDKVKNEYMKKLFYFYIGTHIDISRHEEILRKAIQEVTKEKKKEDEGGGY